MISGFTKKIVLLLLYFIISQTNMAQDLKPYIIIIQPIILQSDNGTNPASMALPENLLDRAYEKAELDFYFLEPIYYNNTEARDGVISLDKIVELAKNDGILKGNGDIVNMFFVNAVDGNKGPLGRGMMGSYISFICLGDGNENDANYKNMQAFVIAHEIGHNLSLKHVVDDPNICDTISNIEGDGDYKDRIDPKYSLTDYQVKVIHESPLVHPRIELLSKKDAKEAILDETFEAYFSQLQETEISVFIQERVSNPDIETSRNYARKRFSDAVIDFSVEEKKCINFVINRINKTLIDNKLNTMANHPWRLIKIDDWLCGGFAHTRGTYIIISKLHIEYLSKSWSENMTAEDEEILIEKFGALLVHEQLHSLQRTYKSKFIDLYTNYWNFIESDSIESDISINKIQVSNPDAPIAEWLIPDPKDGTKYYWLRTLIKENNNDIPIMGKDFTDRVFVLSKNNNRYSLKRDSENKPISLSLNDISFYSKSYPASRGIDHPNEISAYMFSDYFVSLLNKKQAFPDKEVPSYNNSQLFVDWIKNEM